MALITPSIHLNGTAASDLLDGYIKSMNAVREAISVLAENGPNARDYYPQGPGAFIQATNQHAERLEHLATVLDGLKRLADAVAAHV